MALYRRSLSSTGQDARASSNKFTQKYFRNENETNVELNWLEVLRRMTAAKKGVKVLKKKIAVKGATTKTHLVPSTNDTTESTDRVAIAVGSQFGANAAHRNKGQQRPKSPVGNMTLSRRLSQKILKGSPLKSPIVASKLDFSDTTQAKPAVNQSS